MEKGLNLSLTKSLADFEALLDKAIESISSKKLSIRHDLDNGNWKFQIGRYVEIIDDSNNEDDESDEAIFWIGLDWESGEKREPCLWLEFDAGTCPAKYWDKANKLVGTSGQYCSKIDFEFVQAYMSAWVHFYLNEEYLGKFYDENASLSTQKEILTGFINEVLGKL